MAEAKVPTHLLDVCHQKLTEFLFSAEHKRLLWLREIEDEALKMFESNFSTEPELMPKTPSQKKHRKKKRSSFFKDETKELTRKRLSKRRSGVKTASFQRFSPSKEERENPNLEATESPFMTSTAKETSDVQCDKKTVNRGEDGILDTDCEQNNTFKETTGEEIKGIPELLTDHLFKKTKATSLADNSVLTLPDPADSTKTEKDANVHRLRNTSTPKALSTEKPKHEQEEILAEKLVTSLVPEGEISQDSMDRTETPTNAPSRHHLPNRSRKSRRVSLADKYSLSNKRKSTVRKSISRAIAKKKAALDSSSTCSRVSSHSSTEVFIEDEIINHRPLLTLNSESDAILETLHKVPPGLDTPSLIIRHAVQSVPQVEMQQGEICNKEKPETQNTDVQTSGSEDLAQNGTHELQNSWRQSCKNTCGQAMSELPPVQHMQDEKSSYSGHKATSSSASKIMRPFKNFFQSMQKNQLLKPSGSPTYNSVKRGTPSRPPTKGDFVEKERQRLENLRKKQEAEQQRKQKVEEEKRRRLEEIKMKREERLRKAVQARERVEQMEEEKKRRMEKSEKLREEKMAEEKIKRKKSIKKAGEGEARKQKPPQEEEQKLHLQPEKWRTVGEIRKMLEHNSTKLEKGHLEQQDKERQVKPLELAIVTEEEENLKEEKNPVHMEPQKEEAAHTHTVSADSRWLNITAQKSSVGSSSQTNPKKPKDATPHKINANDYGMDLNSDDSTDDESQPRKPIPSWANGLQLNEAVTYQYYNPPDVVRLFGQILSPKLEDIFYKSKPRYFKRTSSAVWQSPPQLGSKTALCTSNIMKK